MQVGDLVVRWWNDKPLWAMVGIIIEKQRMTWLSNPKDGFIVYWHNEPFKKDSLWDTRELRKISEVR